jgi:hypothetical protein
VTAKAGYEGSARVAVVAYEQPGAFGPVGRTTVQRYDVLVGRGAIEGTIFDDTNASGAQDATESDMPGVVVYVDANGNAARDSDESVTLTDSKGRYRFTGLVFGTQRIRTDLPTPAPLRRSRWS